jgi:hypothetical protein
VAIVGFIYYKRGSTVNCSAVGTAVPSSEPVNCQQRCFAALLATIMKLGKRDYEIKKKKRLRSQQNWN